MYLIFTKDMLKNGMVVKTKNGGKYLVVGDRLLSDSGFLHLNENIDKGGYYNEDLIFVDGFGQRREWCKEWDIVAVYEQIYKIDFDSLTILWVRKEVKEVEEIKEVTVAEIEEKFGCKVKIVNG